MKSIEDIYAPFFETLIQKKVLTISSLDMSKKDVDVMTHKILSNDEKIMN